MFIYSIYGYGLRCSRLCLLSILFPTLIVELISTVSFVSLIYFCKAKCSACIFLIMNANRTIKHFFGTDRIMTDQHCEETILNKIENILPNINYSEFIVSRNIVENCGWNTQQKMVINITKKNYSFTFSVLLEMFFLIFFPIRTYFRFWT